MTSTIDEGALVNLVPGSHVGWVVANPERYESEVSELLRRGFAAGEKTVVFGPHEGELLSVLAQRAKMAADPMIDFLQGAFLPETMFSMFRDQFAKARSEGYIGLRVVADMDWLLPLGLASTDVAAFELGLDRVVKELGATVVCAYRQSTFSPDAIEETLSVHPIACGGKEPQFRFVAMDEHMWMLAGDVDVAVESSLDAWIEIAAGDPECVIDISGLRFIDVSGMRLLARACQSNRSLRFRSIPPFFHRMWHVAMFNDVAELKEAG